VLLLSGQSACRGHYAPAYPEWKVGPGSRDFRIVAHALLVVSASARLRLGIRVPGSGRVRGCHILALAVSKIFFAVEGASSTPENTIVTRSAPLRIISAGPTAAAWSPIPS